MVQSYTVKQLLLLFSLMFLLTLTALADGGQWRTYTVADGLPGPDVTIIFQDRLGNLWFGTRTGGVSRFDGENFRSFSSQHGLPDGIVRQILEDKQGNLWFLIGEGPRQENLLCRYDGGRFYQVKEQDGLAGGVSDVMLKDESDNLWFAGRYGLTKHDGRGFHRAGGNEFQEFMLAEDGANERINAIFESRKGDIWLGGASRVRGPGVPGGEPQRGSSFVIRYDGGKLQYFSLESPPDSPSAVIHAIAEDNSGNIWFAGNSVLMRYNGKDFERLDDKGEITLTWKEPLGPTGEPLFDVRAAMPPPPPRTPDDQQAAPPEQNVDKEFRYRHRTARVSVDSIFRDSSGRLWFNNRGFISQWNGSELQHFVIPENWDEIREQDGLDKGEMSGFYPGQVVLEDALGNLWFKSRNGAHRFDGREFRSFTIDDGLGSDNVSVIFQAMDGKFWFGHDNGATLFDPTPPVIQNFTMRAALGSGSVYFIYEDRQGFVWFSVRGGVARYNGEKLQYFSGRGMGDWHSSLANTRPPIDTNFAVSIMDGRDDSLWFVGDMTHQIFQYKDGMFQRYSLWGSGARPINRQFRSGYAYRPRRFGALTELVDTVDAEGNLWFAVGESLYRCNGEDFRLLTADGLQVVPPNMGPGIPGGRRGARRGITDVHIDGKGNIWFVGSDGIKRYDGSELRTFTSTDGIEGGNVRKISEDRQGNLWFAGEQTLTKYDGRSFKSFPVGDATGSPVAIHQNADGIISFIYPGIVARYDGVDFKLLEQGEALVDRLVRASVTDSSGNLWLATNHGLVRYDGQEFTTYTTEDGLLVNDIRDVKEDSQGNLWCATWGGGVGIYNGENFQAITTKDGLVHNNVRGIFEDSRGNIWFATDGGVTRYTLRTDIPGRVRLTKLIADHVYTELGSERLRLPAEVHRVVFEYQGVSPRRANLLYTYRLEGYDSDWGKPWTEQRVEYNGLKPGRYTFLVKALREGTPYSNPPAVVRFAIAQPFWAQSQFYLPASIGAVAVAALLFLSTRLIAQRRRSAVLHAELREKEEAEIQRVKKELQEAREIQMSLLPKAPPRIHQFELAGVSLPASEVGGDFYGYLTLESGLVVVALVDASGKGLHGAMNAVMSHGLLHEVARVESQAGAILSRLNNSLHPLLQDSVFTALNLAVLNPQTKQIQYTNAGQPYPIIKRNGKVESVELGGLPLGLLADVIYDEETISLHPGDYVIFYTDGLNEAMNESEEIYGFDRLRDAIRNAVPNLSAEDMIQHILRDVHAFVGDAEQYDDMTLVVLRSMEA
jgi:serine phosphatase RsbU (regulator of sigma subunit)/ligand-binding sensor domain-containing protein